MAQPFRVVDGDDPGRDWGGWDEQGNVDIPGTLTVQLIRGTSSGAAATSVVAALPTSDALAIRVAGETDPRLVINGDGTIEWGPGTGAADVTLGRYAVGGLEISGALRFTNGQLLFRSDGSVNLYSNAAGTLHTDDAFDADGSISTDGTFAGTAASAAGVLLSGIVSPGDTFDRIRVSAGGVIDIGPGNAARDTNIYRSAANVLATDDDFAVRTAGKGLQVAEGSNARMGRSTLVGGTVVVSNTSVTANSEIFLTCQTPGGTPGFLRVSARTAATSFTILSSSGTDTSVVAWLIVEPSA